LSAAKSGLTPALSRNGEASLEDEPGRLPQRCDTCPRKKDGSCAPRKSLRPPIELEDEQR